MAATRFFESAILPEQKLFLSGSLGPKSPRVTWGREPPKGANSKKCPAPKNFEPHFLENLNFRVKEDLDIGRLTRLNENLWSGFFVK